MKKTCNICKEQITEPHYIEINAILVKQDESYMGTVSFTVDERNDFISKIIAHQRCWSNLLKLKHEDKVLEITDKTVRGG